MNRRVRWSAPAVALFAASTSAFADDKDDRIDRLEKDAAEMRREIAELKTQRSDGLAPGALHAMLGEFLAHDEGGLAGSYAGPGGVRRPTGKVSLGGYFSTRYLASQAGGKPSFVDMRLVPQIHADITQRIAFDAEIEFEHGGISDETHGEIVVEFAELSFRASDAFKFKVGTLLVPFGWFNQNHDDPLNELSSRPDVARYVMPSAFDSPGIGVEGLIEAGEDFGIAYDVVLTNGFKDEFNGEEGSRGARADFEEDDNHNKTVFARVAVVPTVEFFDALTVGVSGAAGAVGDQSDCMRGWGFDVVAKKGPWEFKGEYDAFGIERSSRDGPPIDSVGNLGPTRGLHGYYAQIAYRFTDAWVRSLPFAEDDSSVALVLRRDAIDLNDRVHGSGERDDEQAWSLGVNYRPTTKTVVKFEYRHARSGAPGRIGENRDLFVVEFATYF